ncbi:hypothetical protein ACFXTH_027752 [Malus domestica]
MKREFLEKFFPTSRVILLRKMISGIQQNQDASGGGALVDKTPMAAKTLIANRALNAQQYEGVGQRDTPRQQVNEATTSQGTIHILIRTIQVGETIQISSGESPSSPNNKEALDSNLRASIPSNTHQHKPQNTSGTSLDNDTLLKLLTNLSQGKKIKPKQCKTKTKGWTKWRRKLGRLRSL